MKSIAILVSILSISAVCYAEFVAPTAIHLAYTSDPSQVIFTWQTTEKTMKSTVVILEGLTMKDESVISVTHGDSVTYHKSAGYIHKVVVQNLESNHKYYYTVGDIIQGWSSIHYFFTQPTTGSNQTVNFIQYGDMGCKNSQDTVINVNSLCDIEVHDITDKIDFIMHVGDFAYGDDRTADEYEESWNYYFAQMQKVMFTVPYMVAPGNHEYSCEHFQCDEYSKNFVTYNTRFNMPYQNSGSNSSMFYSWDHANIHFIAISTETDYPDCPYDPVFGNQLAWLENDLIAANNNSNIDWIVVYGHRPIYSSVNGYSSNGIPTGQSKSIQSAFEDLFYQYHVDVYFCGHVHSYERTFPTYNNTVCGSSKDKNKFSNPACPIYVINGMAGNEEGLETNYYSPAPSWSASVQFKDYGYGLVRVDKDKSLTFEAYVNSANGDSYFDWFEIQK